MTMWTHKIVWVNKSIQTILRSKTLASFGLDDFLIDVSVYKELKLRSILLLFFISPVSSQLASGLHH